MDELAMVTARLEESGKPFQWLPLQNGVTAVVTGYGGRLLGPFLPSGESVGWLAPCWRKREAFATFLESGEWNQGGDRLWIAPEIQFAVADRTRFWETLRTPSTMDPGEYCLEAAGGACTLSRDLLLPLHYPWSATMRLWVERTLRAVPDPLREMHGDGGTPDGVVYAGYAQEVRLKDPDGSPFMAEAWNLTQVKPGGVLYIGTYGGSRVVPVDYYEPVDGKHQHIGPGGVRLRISGASRYKVGYKAVQVTGRMAYVRHQPHRSLLMVRQFHSNPSSWYNEEPPHRPGVKGCSLHVYNGGGFGEIENNGHAVGGESGRRVARDSFLTWIYSGSGTAIDRLLTNFIDIGEGCPF